MRGTGGATIPLPHPSSARTRPMTPSPSQHAGRAWVFGDDLTSDALAPGRYMKFGIEEIAKHCLESVDLLFAAQVRPGDVVVGGKNFGAGSSREQAAGVLAHLGVAAVVATSFAGLFYRNAFNLGLPLLVCAKADSILPGDFLEVDFEAARIGNLTRKTVLACDPVAAHLLALIRDGGLLGHLEKRLKKA
jgi:3-isopropylmalate/(R)-2-methylmalate dehydratase small subunit